MSLSYRLFVITCSIVLVSSALLFGQETTSVVEQTIKDWFYPHYQDDVLVWEARGKTAIISNIPAQNSTEESRQIITVELLELIFHHRPEGSSLDQSEELISLKADKGTIYQLERVANLEGNILIETPGKTTLLTQALSVQLGEGKISSRKEVMVMRSGFSLKGQGIKGDLTLKKIAFRHGKKEAILTKCIILNPDSVSPTHSTSSKLSDPEENKAGGNGDIYITCEGPLSYDLEAQEIFFTKNVCIMQKAVHSLPVIQSILKAQTLNITFDSQTNQFQKLRAGGNVLLVTIEGNKAAGDIFTWSLGTHLINIKSNFITKVWHKNNLIEAAEVNIVTSADTIGQLGAWEKVQALNKNGSPGTIKITAPERE